jgi:NAD(P)-dependent dehydrogenase (short-subunit alcohol dehydrogenase family)
MPNRLTDKVAIVTGAASSAPGYGNGAATSILLAREGAHVLLVNRSDEHAAELQSVIESEGGSCSTFAADISDRSQAEAMVAEAVNRYGKLDILCNNVGVGGPGRVTEIDEDIWDRAFDVNVKGTMWCCKSAIPHMTKAGGGSIINISTIAAVRGFKRGDIGFSAYSASKAGMHGLSLAIAADYAAQGVRVNTLLVGAVNTPLMSKLGEDTVERINHDIPMQSNGTAWDVGWAAVYLASDESKWVTGASIPIDGGQTMLMDFPT